jgi:NAD(P)-dependent dehydrogenase (short-subunit alcohol dehydrogenase family)
VSTWFITGCSTGLGRSLAEAVLARGDQAVVTARDVSRVQDLAEVHPDRALAVALDVTDPGQVAVAVAAAQKRFGDIDVLVNNAGYGLLGALEELTDEALRDAFETNLFGALALTRSVLPTMRAQGRGHIVQMSSVIGVTSGPGGSAYAGPKAALEAMSEALAAEVAPLGIDVTIVEPGPFRTDFSGRSLRFAEPMDAYAPLIGPASAAFGASHGTQPNDPYRGAQAIIAAVEAEHPPLRLPLGTEAFGWLRAYLTGRVDALAAAEQLGGDTAYAAG